ncbi:MAG: glycosyltransferase [Muribaculum sp.]|nr:glycosyltransferase [Muribaculum sp.]
MKVLILNSIVNTAEKGVIPRYDSNHDSMIYNMARGFVKLGHDVTLIADNAFLPLKSETNPFETIYLSGYARKIFKPDLLPAPKGLYRYLKENARNFDLILSSELFSIATLIAARIGEARKKLVVWQELTCYQRFLFKLPAKVWYNIVVPLLIGRDIVIVPRSDKARHFISEHGRRVSDEIVDHGVNAEIFFDRNVDQRSRSFIVVSQLIARKRIDRIITKFAGLVSLPEYADCRLDIVGSGAEEGRLKELACELHVGAAVRFHGRLTQQEWAPMASRAAAMLVDTERDLNMVSIAESVANITPVLTNTVPATASFISNNKLGIAISDWGREELIMMLDRQNELRNNCRAIRNSLTNVGAAESIIKIANKCLTADNTSANI